MYGLTNMDQLTFQPGKNLILFRRTIIIITISFFFKHIHPSFYIFVCQLKLISLYNYYYYDSFFL